MSKSMETSNLDKKEAVLSEQSAAFINFLTNRGYLGDKQIDNVKIREAKKKTAARTYHNTQMLLENYRTIIWMVECIPDAIAEELNVPMKNLDTLLDKVDLELSMENRKLESRLYSASKTRLMLDRVNEAISMLRKNPDNGEEMYQIIYKTYIAPPAGSVEILFNDLGITHRRYYKLRKKATMLLSLFLWSAPSSEMEAWMEIVYVLEEINNPDF